MENLELKSRSPQPNNKWGKVFKNGPSKICGREPSENFTWSILEYFVANVTLDCLKNKNQKNILTVQWRMALTEWFGQKFKNIFT